MNIASPIKARQRTSVLFKKVTVPHWLRALMTVSTMFYLTWFTIRTPLVALAVVLLCSMAVWAICAGQPPKPSEKMDSETPRRGRKAAFIASWNKDRLYSLWLLVVLLIAHVFNTYIGITVLF